MTPAAMNDALVDWTSQTLGSNPVAEIFSTIHLSRVVGYRLSDGRQVVVKARHGIERARRCVAVQAALFNDGFPCPQPLTGVAEVDGMATHAEAYVQGEERLVGADNDTVDRFASVLSDLQRRLERVVSEPPLDPPVWLAWDHPGAGVWPEGSMQDRLAHQVEPPWLVDIARRIRARLQSVDLPEVVGHGDWEAQNLRWHNGHVLVVHDWDSLSLRPEAALVGAAAATFPTDSQPVLAPLAASERFLRTYQETRGRQFSDEEVEVAWAAGLWLAAHNARIEVAYGWHPLILDALSEQAGHRLLRAGA